MQSSLELTNDFKTAVASDKVTLSDGNQIPVVGMGTWKITDPAIMNNAVDAALEIGYRHFDSAELYENEHLLGDALKLALPKYNLTRKDIWITGKVVMWNMSREGAISSINTTIESMGCEYLDLVLIHWPTSIGELQGEEARLDCWKGMIEMKNQGLVKSIGVSNFTVKHLSSFLDKCGEQPVMN